MVSSVTPDYFRTIRIPLLAGRYFTEQDTAAAPNVMIIDELLAQHYFAEETPRPPNIIGHDRGVKSWRRRTRQARRVRRRPR